MDKAADPGRAASYGTRNWYTCEACSVIVLTEDKEDGVTPFFLPCVATEGCPGMMKSGVYRGPLGGKEAIPIRPHYVWRKPTASEYAVMSPPMKRHVDQGGLDIYPLAPIDLRTLAPRPDTGRLQ